MILDILMISAIGFLSLSLFALFLFYRQKYIRLLAAIAQLIIDKQIIADKLDEQILLNSKEVNDGFIKFLSESREAAFEYIENVQVSIQNYLNAIETNDNDRILTSRMELFSHLPQKMGDENK